jgi:hypothetical protein
MPQVRSAQLRYLDHLCEVWQIRREAPRHERVDPAPVPTDIYALNREEKHADRMARRRTSWPY